MNLKDDAKWTAIIVFFRNNLRLHNHPALSIATQRGNVIPVYIAPRLEHAYSLLMNPQKSKATFPYPGKRLYFNGIGTHKYAR